MLMTVVFLVTHFFNRKNNYSLLFSTAISEGINDMFKEMGYGGDRIKKKENAGSDSLSANRSGVGANQVIERMN